MTDCTGREIKPGDYVVTSKPDWCETSEIVFARVLSFDYYVNLLAYNPDWQQVERDCWWRGPDQVLILSPDQVPTEIRQQLDAAYGGHK